MKKRTKEENAAYAKAQRLKAKLSAVSPVKNVSPAAVSPKRTVSPVSPAPMIQAADQDAPSLPAPVSCPECSRLRAELVKERAESARLREMVKTFLNKEKTPAAPVAPFLKEKTTPKAQDNDAEALRKRVIAAKVDRINNFGKGHSIGTARI